MSDGREFQATQDDFFFCPCIVSHAMKLILETKRLTMNNESIDVRISRFARAAKILNK